MATPTTQLVTALEDVTKQLQNLNTFLESRRGALNNIAGTPSPSGPTASPGIMSAIPAAWTAQATKNVDFVPSMPIGRPTTLPNRYPSTPGGVATNVSAIEAEVKSIEGETNLTAASELPSSWYKTYAVGSYNLQRQVQAINQFGNYMQNNSTLPFSSAIGSGITSVTSPSGNLTLGNTTITPQQMQFALSAAQSLGHVNQWFGNQASVGQSFGYGPGLLGNSFLGMRLPTEMSKAQRVGMAFAAEQNYLSGTDLHNLGAGAGVTSAQASSIMSTLGSQGFTMNPTWNPWTTTPTGDAATIANGFMAPLMSQMPGLSAQSLAPFTSSLRNSGNDVTSLAMALHNLGIESRSAKESITQFTSDVASASATFTSQGAAQSSAINTATAFTDATGMSPIIGAQMSQNPLIQGLALGQGILPSGIGNMGSGLASLGVNAVKMMAGMVGNQFHDQWKTVNGQRFLVQNGQAMRNSFIAQQLGISASQVNRMLGESTRYLHTANALSLLGQGGAYGTGIDLAATTGDTKRAQQEWNAAQGTFRQAGIKQSTLNQLSHESWKNRINNLRHDLARIGGGGEFNKINSGQNQYTIGLTPEARRFFHLNTGQSPNQKAANAGGRSMNDVLMQPGGDHTKHTFHIAAPPVSAPSAWKLPHSN